MSQAKKPLGSNSPSRLLLSSTMPRCVIRSISSVTRSHSSKPVGLLKRRRYFGNSPAAEISSQGCRRRMECMNSGQHAVGSGQLATPLPSRERLGEGNKLEVADRDSCADFDGVQVATESD